MHLIYIDESGNTGLNLNDQEQPAFALCAMIVEEEKWQSLESELKKVLDVHIPDWCTTEGFEVHASDLRRGRGNFKGMDVGQRISFRQAWMRVGAEHDVRLISRTVDKKRYAQWLLKEFGAGILVNPHVVAFPLLAMCVDAYLKSIKSKPFGMFISDENKEIVADVEKAIRVLKSLEGSLRLERVIEKGFFINSASSLPLQLCDLFTLSLRKRAEIQYGLRQPTTFDKEGIAEAEKLIYENNDHVGDVLKWLKSHHGGKK